MRTGKSDPTVAGPGSGGPADHGLAGHGRETESRAATGSGLRGRETESGTVTGSGLRGRGADPGLATTAGDPPSGVAPVPTGALEPLLQAAEAAVDRLATIAVDGLDDRELEVLLQRVRRPLIQLEGVRSRAAAASVSRAGANAGAAPAGAVLRDRRRRLARQHQVSHTEIQQQVDAGRAARDHAATGQAMADGRVAPRHAQLIAKVLSETPLEQRVAVEQELLELAERLDATAFGRAAREVLGRVRPEALATDEVRQHRARSLRATTTEDGGFAFSGLLFGAAAEQARLAFDAFRRPDTPDERRSPAQRGADAFEQLCAAALRAGAAPTDHGVRPHVMVVFDAADYAALSTAPEQATARFVGSGATVTGREVRNLVDDAEVFRVLLDARGTPIEVSTSVRTVPVGLWRALLARDGGCVWPECDAPASWCDVAHGNRSYVRGGRLSVDNSLLLCRRHHRRFDQGAYRVRIDGDEVTIASVPPATVAPGGSAATELAPRSARDPSATSRQRPPTRPGRATSSHDREIVPLLDRPSGTRRSLVPPPGPTRSSRTAEQPRLPGADP